MDDVAGGLAAGRGQGSQVDGNADIAVVPVAERVVARTAEQLVRPGASEQLVIAGTALMRLSPSKPQIRSSPALLWPARGSWLSFSSPRISAIEVS